MKIKTTRYMTSEKVRALCIKQNYCTNCNNYQYGNLLGMCQAAVNDNDVLRIAEQIMEYSDTETLMKQACCTKTELLTAICYNLLNDCTYTIVELA